MFEALDFRRDEAESGKFQSKEVRELVWKFAEEGPKAGMAYTVGGEKRYVHQVVFPRFSLTPQSRIAETIVKRDKRDPDIVIETIDIMVTPDAVGTDPEPYVFWSPDDNRKEMNKAKATDWNKWAEAPVEEVGKRPVVDMADAKGMLENLKIRHGQNAAGQQNEKKELADLRAAKGAK